MIKKTIILLICFYYLSAVKPIFSQCDTELTGIDSMSNNASFHVLFDDANGQLFLGGGFLKVNTSTVNGLFQWDGISVSDLGDGTDGAGHIRTFASYKNNLYMGGGLEKLTINPEQRDLPFGMA